MSLFLHVVYLNSQIFRDFPIFGNGTQLHQNFPTNLVTKVGLGIPIIVFICLVPESLFMWDTVSSWNGFGKLWICRWDTSIALSTVLFAADRLLRFIEIWEAQYSQYSKLVDNIYSLTFSLAVWIVVESLPSPSFRWKHLVCWPFCCSSGLRQN